MKCYPNLGIQFEQEVLLSSETVQIQWVHLFWHFGSDQDDSIEVHSLPVLSWSALVHFAGGAQDTQTGCLWEGARWEEVLQDHIPCIPSVTGHWCSGSGQNFEMCVLWMWMSDPLHQMVCFANHLLLVHTSGWYRMNILYTGSDLQSKVMSVSSGLWKEISACLNPNTITSLARFLLGCFQNHVFHCLEQEYNCLCLELNQYLKFGCKLQWSVIQLPYGQWWQLCFWTTFNQLIILSWCENKKKLICWFDY